MLIFKISKMLRKPEYDVGNSIKKLEGTDINICKVATIILKFAAKSLNLMAKYAYKISYHSIFALIEPRVESSSVGVAS